METGSRVVATGDVWGGRNRELFNGWSVSVLKYRTVLETWITQQCEYTEYHWSVYFKMAEMVNLMCCHHKNNNKKPLNLAD